MSPILCAGRAEERTPVVATDVKPVGSRISYAVGNDTSDGSLGLKGLRNLVRTPSSHWP